MTLAELRELRNVKAKAATQMNAKYPAGQHMPSAELEQLNALLTEIEGIDAAIEREQRIQALAVDNPQAQIDRLREENTRTPGAHGAESDALRAFLAGGIMNMQDDARRSMMARQNPDIRAAMSTTTAAEGGYTVAQEYMRELETAMRAFGGMRAVATSIRTSSGMTMNFPTADATAEMGEIVGQNGGVTGLDTTFGNATLDVFKYSSKKIALPFELLNDSFIDIEGYIRGLLAMRLARIQNVHFTTGTGTGQPRGIVTAVGAGKVGQTGQTATVTYDDFVDLEHSIDPAYRNLPGVGYMMHDQSLKVVRKIKDSQGRPIFVPGYEAGNPGGSPDRLMGRPITINQDMAQMAANAKSILFGKLNKYITRDVMDLTLFRMTDSAFTLLGQVGFVAFQRVGGNFVDVGGAVKYYQNSAT